MICPNCKRLGQEMCKVMTQTERIQMLSAQASMLRSILSGRNDPDDRKIAHSIIAKLLYSFEEDSRVTLKKYIYDGTGIDLDVKNCPHGRLVSI